MGLRRGLWLAGAVVALAFVLGSCAQPNSGSVNTLGIPSVPVGHGNALGVHPAGPSNAPVCPGPVARGTAGCTSRVITDRGGKPKTNSTPGGYSPLQIQTAYGFSNAYVDGYTGEISTSKREIIAVVDAYDDPHASDDLTVFEDQFNPSGTTFPIQCVFEKVNQSGQQNHYPHVDSGWALEISLDVQWACAMAPDAKVLLVEANSNSLSDLMAAVQEAVDLGANVVSMSWGGSEFSGEVDSDSTFQQAHVTFTASSGDSGTGVIYPAASPDVVGVGGTSLALSFDSVTGDVVIDGEAAWKGSGGGISAYEVPAPSYQTSLATAVLTSNVRTLLGSGRGVPDVAYDADPSYGFSVYDSTKYSGVSGWFIVGGTSAGSPQWAALYALADQAKGSALSSDSTDGSPAYSAATASEYSSRFNDITEGSNCPGGPKHGPKANNQGSAVCSTATGYDLVTGLGSPHADTLVPGL